MDQVVRNIRYLLWKKGVVHSEWQSKLSEWLGCSPERAGELLEGRGAPLTPKEKQALGNVAGLVPKDFSTDLIEKADLDILAENVRYLINGLPHGQKKEFAAKLGIDVTTVSRWVSGAQRPTNKKLQEIGKYFGLSPAIHLASEPIFLWMEPISEGQMRDWIIESIERADGKTLREIFPAMRRLLQS